AREAQRALAGSAYPATDVWSYDGSIPGPLLRYRQGDRLRVVLENTLPDATTVHFHGIRLPNAMDGVPHLTQPPIEPGARFVYEFDLPDAGTYWYHPHLGSPEQVGRGLSGALIIDEAEPVAVDRELVWVLSDWRLDREARIVGDFENFMDASHAGRIGNTVTVNGEVRESVEVAPGERLRLRLINASNARIYGLDFRGHAPVVIAYDGHPVAPHAPEGGRVVLGPAMRADLILDMTGAPGTRHPVVDDFYARMAYRLLDLRYADAPRRGRAGAPLPRLAPNPVAEPVLERAERHRIVFGGGMMGRMPRLASMRGMAWTVNGEPIKAHDAEPILALERGRSVVLELVNDTLWPHPIHLHGHVFRVLSRDGRPTAHREWRDTVLLAPRERAEIAFVADNPGGWMFHCHILEHQATGMMAVIRVA
ncbi:MAG: multicopper oxidase family protein, partial [Burkholderiales bacterium]|nr:multicopper oxidase family protein [Burkholderiales bacterium]